MKYSVGVKFVAVLLCTLLLLGVLGSGISLAALGAVGILSGKTAAEVQQERLLAQLHRYAEEMASIWASEVYGEMPPELVETIREYTQTMYFKEGMASCIIYDEDAGIVYPYEAEGKPQATLRVELDRFNFEHFLTYNVSYWMGRNYEPEEPPREDAFVITYYGSHGGYSYAAYYESIENITVEVAVMEGGSVEETFWELLAILERHVLLLAVSVAVGLLLFAVCAVYLCISAGRKPGSEEVNPAGLNRLPLDLYLAGNLIMDSMILILLDETMQWLQKQTWQTVVSILSALGLFACLGFVGFCFAFAAQVKMHDGFWWRNSLCGRCIRLSLRLLQLVPRIVRACWKVSVVVLTMGWDLLRRFLDGFWKIVGRVLRRAEHFFSLLPLMWQWLLVCGVLALWLLYALSEREEGMFFLGCIAAVLTVCYGANAFGNLFAAVKRMRGGELGEKVDDRYLVGAFREFAGELNGLADVAMVAAQKQLKSERMKTELITNVSHDIKTPLTSIINYVDLLEKPHTPEEEKTYLEVLHRQSQRMKKLIEDLMEMSKASTGNIPVEISRMDAVEAVNQALGEFADKLQNAGLTPIFRQPEAPVYLWADGRLLWRAMDNILNNAVKYAMYGTRLYVEVSALEETAVISFKNISGAQLNISADELMERFVRGDSSRNTEGSGLGLNITRSLMELQKGQLQLLVDGDLFKVTLVFPKAEK